MPPKICWRCLASTRLHPPQPRPSLLRAPFSTTPPTSKNPIAAIKTTKSKASMAASATQRSRGGGAGYQKGRKGKFVPTRRQMSAEQLEAAKRIVLSNTNALEVRGMGDISLQNIAAKESRNTVLGLPGPVVDQLRAANAFRHTQKWGLYRRPAMLIRDETAELAERMEENSKQKSTTRRVLVGERATGKTTTLIQAMTLAFLRGWIVINLPKAQDLVSATSSYAPSSPQTPTPYHLPTLTSALLSSISRANHRILSTLTLTSPSSPPPNLPPHIELPPNLTLDRLALLGASDEDAAPAILSLLLSSLSKPGMPPFLFTLDNLAFAMTDSKYRSADYEPIHAHDLFLVSLFVSRLSGSEPLPNGGMVLAATSAAGDTPALPTLAHCLNPEAADSDPHHPFARYDARVLECFEGKGVEVKEVGKIGKEGARGLLEYWARSGVMPVRVDEERVGREWVMSGGGNLGELERGCVGWGVSLKAR